MNFSLLTRYFLGTAAYGSVRKVCQLWDAETSDYSKYNEPNKPMPLGDKFGVFVSSVLIAPYITPIWIVKDLNYLDVYLRGRDPNEFFNHTKQHVSAFDYVFN